MPHGKEHGDHVEALKCHLGHLLRENKVRVTHGTHVSVVFVVESEWRTPLARLVRGRKEKKKKRGKERKKEKKK